MPLNNPTDPGDRLILRSSADLIVNNSTVLVNVPGLALPMLANDIWEFTLIAVAVSVSTTPDGKLHLTLPAGAVFYALCWEVTTDGGINISSRNDTAATPFGVITSNSVPIIMRGIIINGANAGNAQVQFAQYVATVENTTLKTNSCMIAHRISP